MSDHETLTRTRVKVCSHLKMILLFGWDPRNRSEFPELHGHVTRNFMQKPSKAHKHKSLMIHVHTDGACNPWQSLLMRCHWRGERTTTAKIDGSPEITKLTSGSTSDLLAPAAGMFALAWGSHGSLAMEGGMPMSSLFACWTRGEGVIMLGIRGNGTTQLRLGGIRGNGWYYLITIFLVLK
jgi:hypothetical protein